MDGGWTQDLLTWLQANPGWGIAIVFLVSMLESLVLVGILLPGIAILFGVGTMIGLGVMDLVPVWIAASVGGFAGDSVSYAVGRRYRQHLLEIWPFSRHPRVMERGTVFFQAHGAKSIVAGRFIGPLRPIIPAVTGMLGMTPSRFLAVDIPACIAWAPSFLLPGMLFGASLDVASEYTGRLTVMLLILLAMLWLTWWGIRAIYEPLATRSARWLRHAIRWTRRHPVLGRVAGPLLTPSSGEVLSVVMLGGLLVILSWCVVTLLFLTPFSDQPRLLDQLVRDLALSLRNELADPVMVAISQLSRWPVSVFSATALLLWLLGAGRRSAAAHWLVAVGGGGLLHWLLSIGLRAAPQVLEMSDHTLRSPSAAMSLVTVTLFYFAVMEARELKRRHRQWPYLVAALVVMLLALARLYLGLEWLSGALMGVLLALAWTGIVGLAYRQRAFKHFSGRTASLIFYVSFFGLFAWQAQEHNAEDLVALKPAPEIRELAAQDWWTEEWRSLPMERTRLARGGARRFDAQLDVDLDRLAGALEQVGWQRSDGGDWRWLIQSLNPEPDESSLPLLARAYQGQREARLLSLSLPAENRQLTIRLWDSGVRLKPGDRVLYLVQLAEERLVQRLGLFSYWRPEELPLDREIEVLGTLPGTELRRAGEYLLLVRERPVE